MVIRTASLLVSILIMAALLLLVHPPTLTPIGQALLNSGHIVLFAVFSLLLFPVFQQLVRNFYKQPTIYLEVLCFLTIASCVGIFIEFVQSKIGRDASWGDVAFNLAGLLAGLCWLGVSRLTTTAFKTLCVAGLVSALGLALAEPAKLFYASNQRNSAFPVIANFDTPSTNVFIKENTSAKIEFVSAVSLDVLDKISDKTIANNKLLKVTFPSNTSWPGWAITNPVKDWSGYSHITFTIISKESTPVEIVVRINDTIHNHSYHDRFNKTLVINPGVNKFSIPLTNIKNAPQNRQMNITKISHLVWFSVRPQNDFVLYFDNVRLQ